jgi:hypothetical protein
VESIIYADSVPTRKQRRRREKEHRHEYEFVTIDEEGQEVPVDPAELKPARPEKSAAKGKPTQAKDRRGRPLRPANPPSFRRAGTRALIFVVALFAFTSLVGKTHPPLATRIAIALAYGVIGVPFFYWMDRAAYRRYLRATGREDEIPTPKRGLRR